VSDTDFLSSQLEAVLTAALDDGLDAAERRALLARVSGYTPEDFQDAADEAGFAGDDSLALAEHYATLFSALPEVPDADLAQADAELAGTGWRLARGGEGWAVEGEAGGDAAFAWGDAEFAQHRAPKGGVSLGGQWFPGGQWIPAAELAKATPEQRAEVEGAKAGHEQALAARAKAAPTDAVALRDRLAPHAGDLNASEKARALASWRALQAHHGGHALHRLSELTALAEAGLARAKGDTPGDRNRRAELGRTLSRYHFVAAQQAPAPAPTVNPLTVASARDARVLDALGRGELPGFVPPGERARLEAAAPAEVAAWRAAMRAHYALPDLTQRLAHRGALGKAHDELRKAYERYHFTLTRQSTHAEIGHDSGSAGDVAGAAGGGRAPRPDLPGGRTGATGRGATPRGGEGGADPARGEDELRRAVQAATHKFGDVAGGKYPVGVEGGAGKDAERARAQGLYVNTVNGVTLYAKTPEGARPLEDYLRAGGRYGTPEFSRLLGYTPAEVKTYEDYLRASGQANLIAPQEAAHAPPPPPAPSPPPPAPEAPKAAPAAPQPPTPHFTGIDAHGHEWVDGRQVTRAGRAGEGGSRFVARKAASADDAVKQLKSLLSHKDALDPTKLHDHARLILSKVPPKKWPEVVARATGKTPRWPGKSVIMEDKHLLSQAAHELQGGSLADEHEMFHGTHSSNLGSIDATGLRAGKAPTAGKAVYLSPGPGGALYERRPGAGGVVQAGGQQPDTLLSVKVRGKLFDAGEQGTPGGWSVYAKPDAQMAAALLGRERMFDMLDDDKRERAVAEMREKGYSGVRFRFPDGRVGVAVFNPADLSKPVVRPRPA
jgi:hypothetical protein